MWERKETDKNRQSFRPANKDVPRTAAAPAPDFQPRTSTAKIGQSLFIKGEVTGSEDLTVEGRVEGKIDLVDHNLTIGPNGRVKAHIHAKNITIVGEVVGDVAADEKVDLTDTANLVGDIRAPRIAVSDGAKFKGSVDMVHATDKQSKHQVGSTDHVKGKTMTPSVIQVGQTAKSVQ